MSSNAVVIAPNGAVATPQDFSTQQIELIKKTIMPGADEVEFATFLNLCKAKRLDPLTRQIYAIKPRNGGWQTFASIDGLRVIAQRSGQYAGQVGPLWCGEDGKWVDVWLASGSPAAAKVGVLRKGWPEPLWGVATFRSYGKDQGTWSKMPDVMLAKCAEAIALRKAFPDDLAALYVREEFDAPEAPESFTETPRQHASHPNAPAVEGEVIDQQTGEIQSAPINQQQRALELAELLRGKREALGWSVAKLQAVAAHAGHNLRTIEGLEAMWRELIDLSAVMDSIRDTGDQLGWLAMQVAEQAELGGYDLTDLPQARAFLEELQALKRATLDGPDEEPEQGTLLEADVAPLNRWDD